MSDARSGETVLVYADYVCPFCYLGYESLDRYRTQRDEELDVEWHPFDLRFRQRGPDGSVDESAGGKSDAYYEQAKRNVRELADRYDVEMAQELRTDVDSYDAQRVGLRARETHPDRFEGFHRAVFDALWEDGRDIGDGDVLAEIAADAGLPDGFVSETLADDDSSEALQSAFQAAHSAGITGVPTFVYDEYEARGAVPPEQLRRFVEGS